MLQFKKAKVDKRIKVILLDIDMSRRGLGQIGRDSRRDRRLSLLRQTRLRLYGIRHEQGVLHRQRLRQDLCCRRRASCSSTDWPPT